jgi:hypothetical protein
MNLFIGGCGYYFPHPSLPFTLLDSQFRMLSPFFTNHTLVIISSYVIVIFYRIQTFPVLHASAITVWVSYVRYPGLYRTSCIHIIHFHTGFGNTYQSFTFLHVAPFIISSTHLSSCTLSSLHIYLYSYLTQDNVTLHVI